jgi:hypothetical protein
MKLRLWLKIVALAFGAALALGSSGCAVITVAGAAAGAAVSVTGAVTAGAVTVGAKVVTKAIDVVTPSSDAPPAK